MALQTFHKHLCVLEGRSLLVPFVTGHLRHRPPWASFNLFAMSRTLQCSSLSQTAHSAQFPLVIYWFLVTRGFIMIRYQFTPPVHWNSHGTRPFPMLCCSSHCHMTSGCSFPKKWGEKGEFVVSLHAGGVSGQEPKEQSAQQRAWT